MIRWLALLRTPPQVIDPARYQPEPHTESLLARSGPDLLFRFNDPEIKHLDGVPWHSAPAPPRRHKCWPQSDGWVGFERIQRCACGAIRGSRYGNTWFERNQRRRAAQNPARTTAVRL